MSNTNSIEKSIELKAPVSRVWRALIDHREFGTWFHVALEGPFVAGQPAQGRITVPGFDHVMRVTVQRIEPESYFSFTWHPYALDKSVDYAQETPTLVEFRLVAKDGGTLLTVTESGFDKLPAHRRDEAFRMNDGGWTQQMQNIRNHVDA
jgi:uncharacterized protein YndB with AHSA1/START domain